MKNKYVKRSKISEAKFRKIIMCFAMELDAQQIAALTSLNRNTINRYVGRIRSRMVDLCARQTDRKWRCGQAGPDGFAAAAVTTASPATDDILPVFGIQALNTHIHTEIIDKKAYRKVRQFIRRRPDRLPLALPEEWQRYHAIVDINGRWHYRMASPGNHGPIPEETTGSIDAFLGFARKRLTTVQLNGTDHFNLYLKECEFRFNNRNADLYKLLLKDFRNNPMA
jgi:hypothetical protein